MASPSWFYYPFTDIEQSSIEIEGPEVNHILGAKRLRVGDELVLMNGQGALAHCTLEQANKKARKIQLRVSLVAEVEPPAVQRILACALPKGDRLSGMLDMACQLGMTAFQPLQFEYSVSRWSDKLQARCERVVLEAAKQSKRARVPGILPIQSYSEWSASNCNLQQGDLCVLADQFGLPVSHIHEKASRVKRFILIVGPEGGLSDSENKLAQQHNIRPVRLAEPILRIETAAIAGMAALNQTGQA